MYFRSNFYFCVGVLLHVHEHLNIIFFIRGKDNIGAQIQCLLFFGL